MIAFAKAGAVEKDDRSDDEDQEVIISDDNDEDFGAPTTTVAATATKSFGSKGTHAPANGKNGKAL